MTEGWARRQRGEVEPRCRRSAGSAVLAFFARLASRAPDFFRIPQEGLFEVGFRVEI